MKIRKAVLSDAKGIAKVHVDSWRTTYANIVPDEYLIELNYKERENLWKKIISTNDTVFVAVDEDGKIVGFSSGGKERIGKYKEYDGELYAIYILKEYQGQGIGKLLVKSIIDQLKNSKMSSMLVFVLEDNRSKYFYEALGAEKTDTVEVEISGKKLSEAVYGWSNINSISTC